MYIPCSDKLHRSTGVALSCLGSANGVFLTGSRLFVIGARHRHVPRLFAQVQIHTHTPVPSAILTGLLAVIYLLASGNNIFALINCLAICVWLSIGISVFCVIWLRYARPHATRPFRVPLTLPVLYCAASVYLVAVPIWVEPWTSLVGLLLASTGIPVFWLFCKWRLAGTMQWMRTIEWVVQVLTLCVEEEISKS